MAGAVGAWLRIEGIISTTELRRPVAAAERAGAVAKAHLPALTGLRFVLATWVILHHLTGKGMMLEPWAAGLPAAARNVVREGYLAVGTFFVLSGFVLARTYGGPWTGRNLWRYGVSRFARIYPVYALSLAILIPFIAGANLPGTTKAGLLANYVLLLQGWTGKLPVNWNTPAWSLSCEIFFYLCFPLAAVLFGGGRWRRVLPLALAVCALPAALKWLGVPDELKPLTHLADFLIGILTARAYGLTEQWGKAAGRGAWLYGPAAVASVALIAWLGLRPGQMLENLLRPLNAALILGLALGGGAAAAWFSTRGMVYLGKASYAMYILHVPLLWWYRTFGPPLFGAPAWLAASVFVVGVVAVAAVVYRVVEEPANRGLRAIMSGR